MKQISAGRSNIYGFLAKIYEKEITADFLQHLKDPKFQRSFSELGIQITSDFLGKQEKELLEEFSVEYAWLFLGPGKYISPHESVHHVLEGGDWGSLWGKSTVEVKNFIETAGLEFQTNYKGMPDHISVELEFMRHATLRESQAWENEDFEGAVYCLKMEKMFLHQHLAQWTTPFCDQVIEKSRLLFYREIAVITKEYIAYENQNMDIYLSEAEKIISAVY